ncbi:four helix bundle protein [Oryzicola mucosus]|uniref:Four helix bundle protein n=1 Tax=Oryzicola mucosus TaxID=2767425 RepID=A0A8J6U4Q3_9HYPH|nr:four helix bundle protein [Oryzicola mucosus]
MINSYRDLLVWKAAMELAVACYSVTKAFPNSEVYGMTSQIRRSAASIAANIAEGHGRENTGAFIQFLRIAQGSLKELETHLLLSGQVGLLSDTALSPLLSKAEDIGKMLRAMIRSLQQKTP